MPQKLYQADAFADKAFSGNPAAICPLKEWLSDELMQQVAMENNLAETAFIVKQGEQYHIRWFTPTVEVDLCGHATLAAAYVLFDHEGHVGNSIEFYSHRSGVLPVTKEGDLLTLNFPADDFKQVELTGDISDAFNTVPEAAFKGKTDYLLTFRNEAEIRGLKPIFDRIAKLDVRGVIVTAKGDTVDFVSRFFAPQSGVDEDPVTGSAHTTLTPYWAQQLGKKELTAMQLSQRKGHLRCRHLGNRVEISGRCRLFLIGEIYLD